MPLRTISRTVAFDPTIRSKGSSPMPTTKHLALIVVLIAALGAVMWRRSGDSLNPQPEPPGLNPQPEPPGLV
jgi:hypothetical protein